MNCVINSVIDTYLRKGKKIEVIRRYIRMKYRIYIDLTSIQERVKFINMKYEY